MRSAVTPHRFRSFVRRDSRETTAQQKAFEQYWSQFGCDGLVNETVFAHQAPIFLEIGFGMGTSFVECARAFPHFNFVGVETHKPGIGAVIQALLSQNITNVRLIYGDVVEALQRIPDHSLTGVNIFFPDPWQKRKHHERRLIQPEFISNIVAKLKANGELHLATDWQDYATHMLRVLSAEKRLQNLHDKYGERSRFRPIASKFELRALKEKRSISDFQFGVRHVEQF